MAMKILEENIDKSIRCSIEFNGVTGYEILDGYIQHTVCLREMECSCRSWMLKGIPCAHALAAMLNKQYDPQDFIHSCYSKERYIQTYSHFIQPMNNMPMWPESTNPIVSAPLIKNLPGRPKKLRRKKAGASKMSGKISKTGVVMTCSLCHVKGHNKRGCHLLRTDGVSSNAGEENATSSSTIAEPSTNLRKERGRPKKPTNNESDQPAVKRGRGRPRKHEATRPSVSRNEVVTAEISAGGGRGAPTGMGRGRGRGEARGVNHPLESWFTCSQGSTTHNASQNSSPAPKESANVNERSGARNTTKFKRPGVIGMGVFQAENGVKTLNPRLPSTRILSTGPKRVLKSSVITGDIGFKPTSGLKWKGNQTITTRRLEEIRDQSRTLN